MPFKKTNSRDTQQYTDLKRLFIGRTDYLSFFVNNILKPEDPSHNILSISGQGGVGKSTLLQRFLDEVHSLDFREYCFAAKVNEQEATPASVMERFADQFREQGRPLKKFEEQLTRYKEALRRMQITGYYSENDELVHEVADTVGTVMDDIPFAGDIVHKGTNVITEFVLEKGRTHQFLKDAAHLEDPIRDLTKVFVKDLNLQADILVSLSNSWAKRSCRFLLFFDTFEQLTPDIAPWLLDHFLNADVSTNIVLVIAGRGSIESSMPDDPKRWLPFIDSKAIYLISLKTFTEEETRAYLQRRGIIDSEKIRTVSQLSKGLPLYLSMLTSNPEGRIDPNAEVVENFLRWIPKHEVQKRQLALNASLFSLPFTKDDLAAFSYTEPERTDLYQWLIIQPFIQINPQDGRHTYHDLARDLFCRYLYHRSLEDYYLARKNLTRHYHGKIEELQSQGGVYIYTTHIWRELVFALIQQVFLLPDEESYLIGIGYVIQCYEHSVEDDELIKVLRTLLSPNLDYLLTVSAQRIITKLLQYVEGNAAEQYQKQVEAANSLLEHVIQFLSFPTEVKANIYRHRGRAYRLIGKYQNAIESYNQALLLASNASFKPGQLQSVYGGRGATYRLMKRYEEAVADLTRAIELDANDDWAIACRGATYRSMERYEEAVADFTRAIELDDKYAWAIANRGATYGLMKRYEEALADFTRAIELDDKYAWAIACRGATYRSMERYEEAVVDLTRAIELDAKYTVAIACRGATYRLMKRYEEAVADLTRAIELDANDDWAIANRGETYRLMKRYKEALTDLTRAIELDANDDWNIASRGQTYQAMERYEEALADLTRAIKLNEKNDWAIASRGETYRSMERYEEALADFTRAIELDANDDWFWYNKALVHFLTNQMDNFYSDLHNARNIAKIKLNDSLPQSIDYYRLCFHMALYLLAESSIEYALKEYYQLCTTCSAVTQLENAIDDLKELLVIQSMNVSVKQVIHQIEDRIHQLESI